MATSGASEARVRNASAATSAVTPRSAADGRRCSSLAVRYRAPAAHAKASPSFWPHAATRATLGVTAASAALARPTFRQRGKAAAANSPVSTTPVAIAAAFMRRMATGGQVSSPSAASRTSGAAST